MVRGPVLTGSRIYHLVHSSAGGEGRKEDVRGKLRVGALSRGRSYTSHEAMLAKSREERLTLIYILPGAINRLFSQERYDENNI